MTDLNWASVVDHYLLTDIMRLMIHETLAEINTI